MIPTPKYATPIEYIRWKHKERGYIVRVTALANYRGKLGCLTVVTVARKGFRNVEWSAPLFIQTFTPLGRKRRVKSRIDLINQD